MQNLLTYWFSSQEISGRGIINRKYSKQSWISQCGGGVIQERWRCRIESRGEGKDSEAPELLLFSVGFAGSRLNSALTQCGAAAAAPN